MLRQRKVGKWWGYLMQIIQQEAVVFQGTLLILQVITTATVLQIAGRQIPVWLLAGIVAILLIIGGVAIWMVGMPSYFSAFNDQFAKHDNPIMERMDKYEKNQKKIMEKLGIKYED